MKNRIFIVTCENNLNLSLFDKNSIFIGVERGCIDIINKNIKLSFAVSDFDNVEENEMKLIEKNAESLTILDAQKDWLDGKEAIKLAKTLDYSEIIFICKPTKRMDMNLSVIDFVLRDDVKILNDNSYIFKLKVGSNKILFNQFQDYTYITLFAIENTTVTIENLKYEVQNLILEPYSTRAYSNCFSMNKDANIIVSKPAIIIFNK
ncbi:motility associated factor glycosyltransferase family protein [Spiroplasma apis]|uniref:Thiamine pyrophosphokinase n=1 Tax=Spiroplasma apis B31 TaxID=1276258 RepID=V5RLH0_SPIAP|nr:thiamine pyrophosphokinase [Spiroplasma apis]AHB36680.1 thiamine pyrophosphokinase [Spiroplasma apis B31]